jgi:RNA polymerase sigma-70 factor (ECF subfamily)
MSVVRPDPAQDSEAALDRDSPDGEERDSTAPSADSEGVPKTSRPPPMPLNTRKFSASNHKQQRAKEAEEDRALIARAQAGDTAAFRRLVERHQRRAFAIALALVRDENDARELVQDAFLRVFKGLHSFQGGSSFFTWLYRIITNLSIDLIRKPGRQTSDLDDARLDVEESPEVEQPFLSRVEGADPIELVRRREIGSRLQTALDALPSYHRAVIVMREVEGLSYEEMAQAMGVSKGTIMSRLFHARQKLQRALADCYKEQIGVAPPKRDEGEEPAASSGEGEDKR